MTPTHTSPSLMAHSHADASAARSLRTTRVRSPTLLLPVAALIGADPKEIVFTSGATESNNMAIKGVARFYRCVAAVRLAHGMVYA